MGSIVPFWGCFQNRGPCDEAAAVANRLGGAHKEGHAWADVDLCADALRRRGLPHQVRKGVGTFDPAAGSIKVMTLHVSKGLEFPVVAMVGVGHMPAPGEDERDEARLFYVGATRATQRLVIGASGGGTFTACL